MLADHGAFNGVAQPTNFPAGFFHIFSGSYDYEFAHCKVTPVYTNKAPGGIAVAMRIPGGSEISGTQLRKFEDVVKQAGAGGLTFFKVLPADREKQLVIFPGVAISLTVFGTNLLGDALRDILDPRQRS
mgnify:CR=1 FL=1